MCRLLAQLSAEPRPAEPFLTEDGCSLLKQSDIRPNQLQKDGWGIARYEGTSKTPVVVKSPRPAFKEPKQVGEAAKVPARILLAHIRAASNPKKLPDAELLGPQNTQPFSDGTVSFAHNGTVYVPDALAATLGALRERIGGINDSEVYFYQFLRHLEARRGDPFSAFRDCVEELWTLPCDAPKPYLGLNVVASDGERLFAFCHYPETGLRSFCSDAPWGRMAFSAQDDRVLVASEKLGAGWSYLDDPEVLVAWPKDGAIKLERRRLALSAKPAAYKKVEAPRGDPAAPGRP